MFHLLLNVVSLTGRLAYGNITEALTEVYAFILTQEAKVPMFTEKEFSNQVGSLLMLLDTRTDMSDEPAEASICFSAAFCWTLTKQHLRLLNLVTLCVVILLLVTMQSLKSLRS